MALPPVVVEALRGVQEVQQEQKAMLGTRFHDLRHVHVTHLAKAGVPIKVAMDRVGHSTVAPALGIYSHTLPVRMPTRRARSRR